MAFLANLASLFPLGMETPKDRTSATERGCSSAIRWEQTTETPASSAPPCPL